ncbi:Hpt domain [Carpediemonas membranifera]|uniref:Hpt domain n=1 Tax=Carpediemonas membranifera TaxID=201153 RepID=A0A8J6AZI5_9EUKA|nr:Hpt domain [Carpediemonas membranifera]|eukprot:KAG9392208.1 Hpt domain [Carpediemonas membranifera]
MTSETTPAMSEYTETLDTEIWEDLREANEDDPSFVDEITGIFVTSAKESIEQLKEAWDAKEMDSIQRYAHKLRGSSSQVGLINFQELMGNIMSDATKHDKEKIGANMEHLDGQWDVSLATLMAEVSKA